MNLAVSLHDVTVCYSGHVALHGVTLDIQPHEFLGIIGPNGAGKSTLLTVINGLTRPCFGEVRIDGQPVKPSSWPRLRCRIGYVPQRLTIDPRSPVSCFESVLLGRYGRLGLLHPPGATDRQVASAMLEFTGTAHLRDRPVGRVSGGEARRIAIARALTQEPDLLLLDEPTANLDRTALRDITRLIADCYHRFNLTVVMVTHQLDHLPSLCTRIAMMKDACLVSAGPRDEVLTSDRLTLLYDAE